MTSFVQGIPAYCITYLCLNLKIGSNAKSYIVRVIKVVGHIDIGWESLDCVMPTG